MISQIDFNIDELSSMKRYPNELFYIGNKDLLKKRKVAIIGSRRPSSYTKEFTYKLSSNVIYKNKLKSTRIILNRIFYSFKIIYVL